MNFWNNRLEKRGRGSPLARQLIKWHPIYIELIEGSGERLVIAIVGGTKEEVRVKMIEGFHEAFGPEVEAALAATRPMLDAVTEALRTGSIDLLSSADALGPGLFVGEARQIMTANIDAALEAAARISSSVFNAKLPAERASQPADELKSYQEIGVPNYRELTASIKEISQGITESSFLSEYASIQAILRPFENPKNRVMVMAD
jgi:hypothetical protein